MAEINKLRETWKTRAGIILAVAGSAVGLGNFLRFPVQVAQNGGGAFMIPYFISFFLLGIPLMWIEWTAGRFGGGFGHGTAPGIFHSMWEKNRFIKYFGVIGIFGPVLIFIYYTYVESWLLGYAFFSITGRYAQATTQAAMQSFLQGYQGLQANEYFHSIGWAYLFFVITFSLNVFVVYYGIRKGIERLCNWAMPVLLICGIILAVRVLSLGIPDLSKPDWNLRNGLGFLWNPNFAALKSARVWLAASGQIFFTLSVGIGVILTYASYLTKRDDVALSGLTAAATNEFAEVVLGASIIIPAAFVFFGPREIVNIAQSGAFNLGFVTMPLIFQKIPLGAIFALLWFTLLFLAGMTSSVSLAQPVISFLEDEFNITKRKSATTFGIVTFILCQPSIFLLGKGVLNELDFWGGTFCLVLFATIETIVFAWIFGIDRAWEEIHHGADIVIPRFYKFIIKYITPLFLLSILGFWLVKEGLPTITMRNVTPEQYPYVLFIRVLILVIFIVLALSVAYAWKKRKILIRQEK